MNIHDAVGWDLHIFCPVPFLQQPEQECGPDGDTVMTCATARVDCHLKYLYCLRPYGSPAPDVPPPPDMPDVPLLPQAPLTTTTFEEGFIVVGGQDNFFGTGQIPSPESCNCGR